MTLTETLAARLARRVGEADRRRAALHLVDWLGCALAGRIDASSRIAHAAFSPLDGPSVLVGGGRAAPRDAAYLNGLPGNVLEMDDVHRRATLHPGPTVTPAALALATAATPGPDFLDALVRGYEAVIRIGRALGPGHYAHFHNTATAGPFGAAAAASSMLALKASATVDALANAGTVAAGLWQCRHEPVMTKQLHAAHAAHAGLVAAILAARGFTGPKTLLEGPQGFFVGLCPDGDPLAVVADPEGPWLIHEVSFKPWAACRHAHPTIDAARLVRAVAPSGEIAKVDVRTYADAVRFCDNPEPQSVPAAKFSLQHAVAVALLRDRPALEDFDPPAIADPVVAALRAKVNVVVDESFSRSYPSHFGAAVVVNLRGGETRGAAVRDALGDPENPLAETEVMEKALTLMRRAGVPPGPSKTLVAEATALPSASAMVTFLSAVEEARPSAPLG